MYASSLLKLALAFPNQQPEFFIIFNQSSDSLRPLCRRITILSESTIRIQSVTIFNIIEQKAGNSRQN
jgi:hypothetical protein